MVLHAGISGLIWYVMYAVAITGASGPIIGIRLIEELLLRGHSVGAVVSNDAWATLHYELYRNSEKPSDIRSVLERRNSPADFSLLKEYSINDYYSPLASGTGKCRALIVAPCSMKTLSAVATGYADSLITRAVDVSLKEGRKTILVPRETPMNLIHLENMVKAKEAGADILLPVPGFYTFPQSIDDVVNFIVGKALNLLGIDHDLFDSWDENKK
jgi:4-hydroxy-3-polyprenylbenzoate decarboxylase